MTQPTTQPNESPSSDDDLDDSLEPLDAELRAEREKLTRSSRAERELRKLKQDANRDSQDFRDLIDGSSPATTSDVEADARHELEEQERLDVLDGLRALQTGDPINWKIYRVGSQDADMNGYLGTWATSQLTQERIKDEYGGGTYRIRGSASSGKFVGGRTIHIAGDAIRKEKNIVSQGGASSFNLSEFLTQQEARDAARRKDDETRRERERRESEEREDKRRRERNEMLAVVMPAVTGLTSALIGAFSNRGPDIAGLIAALKPPDPLTMLTQLKALNGNNQGLAEKLVPMLLDKATDGGGGGGETGWMDVVKEVVKSAGPTVGGMIESAVAQARANATSSAISAERSGMPPISNTPMISGPVPSVMPADRPAPLLVVPESMPRRERRLRSASEVRPVESGGLHGRGPGSSAATVGGSSTTAIPVERGADMNLVSLLPHVPWLRDQLARMGTAAVRGKDPDVYAALFLEELPDGVSPGLVVQLLSRGDWYQQLCQLEPRLNREDLVPWFERMRQYLLGYLQNSSGPVEGGPVVASTPSIPAPVPAPTKSPPTEIQRPTKLPSLMGDD